jgi:hypothetical protein
MSLYTHEEICEGCISAIWHYCCEKFCSCTLNHKEDCDFYKGKCFHKETV